MVNKDGQYITKLPTPLSNPGNKRDFKEEKRKCVRCGKRRVQSYIEKDTTNGKEYKVLKCFKCDYSNYNPII